MIVTLAGLIGFSLLLMVAGVVWLLVASGGLRRREVSAEEAAEILAGRDEVRPGVTAEVEKSAFAGKAVGASAEASISLGELGTAIRRGRGGEVAPWLLAIAGFAGVLLFSVPLIWLVVGPWAGAGWFLLLLVTIVRGYRNREKEEL